MANVITEDRASGAQVIDGSLKFDSSSDQYLTKTFGSAGNRKTNTVSFWMKRYSFGDNYQRIFNCDTASNTLQEITLNNEGGSNSDNLISERYISSQSRIRTNALLRDTGWYHIVVVYNSPAATQADRQIIYINGERQSTNNSVSVGQNDDGMFSSANEHRIGRGRNYPINFNGSLSNFYFIDGQALGPGYFGFTDPLTNIWRPKKFLAEGTTVNDGTVWSGYGDSNAASGFEWTHAFDGSFGANDYVTGTSTYTTITFPKPIEAENIYLFLGTGTTAGLRINGVQITDVVGAYNNSARYKVGTNGEGNFLETISLYNSGTQWSILYAIEVGGVIMRDSTTTNLDFGTNGFYLPMDGNSPIGEDKSGRGNNWTPVNFGGSVALDNPIVSGALPILNTDGGGNVARVGVRTDAYHANLVLALPLVGNVNDVSNSVNSGSTTKTITASNTTHSSARSNFYGGSIYFDDTADEYLSFPGATFSGEFCAEFWYYSNALATNNGTITVMLSGDALDQFQIADGSSNGIQVYFDGSLRMSVGSATPLNMWHHIAFTRDSSNVLKLYVNGIQKGSTPTVSTSEAVTTFYLGIQYRSGYVDYHRTNGYIQDFRIYNGTVKYSSDFIIPATSPDILPDTPSGVSGGSKLAKVTDGAVSFDGSGDYLQVSNSNDFDLGSGDFTWECFAYVTDLNTGTPQWFFSVFSSSSGDNAWGLRLEGDGRLYAYLSSDGGESPTTIGPTLANSSMGDKRWHHLAVVRSGSSSNNITVYVDGISRATGSFTGTVRDTSLPLQVGRQGSGSYTQYLNGFVSNLRIIKGTALYTSNFTPPTAPLTNVTNTKLLCCQSNTSAITAAVTPGTITANGNAAATNFNPFNTDINTVRGQETGYATLNPLASASTLSNGNLTMTSGASWGACLSTVAFTGGKYYWETYVVSSNYSYLGVSRSTHLVSDYPSKNKSWALLNDGNCYYDQLGGEAITVNTGTAVPAGATVGTAVDADSGKIWWSVNGVWIGSSGVPNNGSGIFSNIPTNESLVACVDVYSNTATMNFGQKPFKFPPPAGFQPLNAANVKPETVITRPDLNVSAKIYTGNGNSRSINVGIKPDFVWIKKTNSASDGEHMLYDTVRGAGKYLQSQSTAAETTDISTLSSFNSDGFSLGNDHQVNKSSDEYVSLSWRAGGSGSQPFYKDDIGYASAAEVGLTGASITPDSASIGTKQGFSILKYEGIGGMDRSIPHGLGKVPKFIIVKNLDTVNAESWPVWSNAYNNNGKSLRLNTTASAGNNDQYFDGDLPPTTTTFTVGSNESINTNGDNYIAYVWADVPGLQRFGKFNGNSDANGVFVELGFKPTILLIKNWNSTGDWIIWDSARNPVNPVNRQIWPYTTSGTYGAYDQVGTDYPLDFLSNGFKMRTTDADMNSSSRSYLYAAWAEAPTFNLYGGQSNAR